VAANKYSMSCQNFNDSDSLALSAGVSLR